MAQREGETDVVDTADKITAAGVLPDLLHQSRFRVVESKPAGVSPEMVDFTDPFICGERLGANNRIAQERVNFD
jgi:hypothetical protein